jgi:hypothetical protein
MKSSLTQQCLQIVHMGIVQVLQNVFTADGQARFVVADRIDSNMQIWAQQGNGRMTRSDYLICKARN